MPTYVGFVVLYVAVLLGQMVFLACLAVLTPVTTPLPGHVWLRVLQPARCAPFDGWDNLVFITIVIMLAAILAAALA